MQRKLSIVIPCLNEEEAIPFVLERVRQVRSDLATVGVNEIELIVVDDASTDTSPDILSQYADVVLIRNKSRQGYGGALKAGFHQASGDLIAFYDMDATYDPAELVPMIRVLDSGARLVCGDRLSRYSGMPLTRKIGNEFFVGTIRFLFRRAVADSCTGLRVFRSESRSDFVGENLPNNLNYSLAMTMHCLSSGIHLEEIPVRYDRRIGSSKLSVLIDGPRFFYTIMKHWTRYESRHFVRRLTTF